MLQLIMQVDVRFGCMQLAFLALTLFGCASTPSEVPSSAMANIATGKPLRMLQGGVWQQFVVPNSWLKQYLDNESYSSAYITLRSPAASDFGVYSPCRPPPQILLGLVGDDFDLQEYLIACPDTCDQSAEGQTLWGYRTQILGINVSLMQDGLLDIAVSFQENADDPIPLTGPDSFAAPTKGEVRARHYQVSPAEIRVLLERKKPITACYDFLEGDLISGSNQGPLDQ